MSTLHDHTRYFTLPDNGGVLSLNTSGGTLLKLLMQDSDKRYVLIHHYSLQSESDGQSVYFYQNDTATSQISQKWTFNSREGVAKPFVPSPGYLLRTFKPGVDIGLYLGASTVLDFEIVYSLTDEAMWANWKDGEQARRNAGPIV